MRLSGAFGAETRKADLFGTLHCHALPFGDNISDGSNIAGAISIKATTVPGMNANLLSFNELHDIGWSMTVPPHDTPDAFCGWSRCDANGVTHRIPVVRNGNSWESQLIVADTPVLAATVADAAALIRGGASIDDFAHLAVTPMLAHLLRDAASIGIFTRENHQQIDRSHYGAPAITPCNSMTAPCTTTSAQPGASGTVRTGIITGHMLAAATPPPARTDRVSIDGAGVIIYTASIPGTDRTYLDSNTGESHTIFVDVLLVRDTRSHTYTDPGGGRSAGTGISVAASAELSEETCGTIHISPAALRSTTSVILGGRYNAYPVIVENEEGGGTIDFEPVYHQNREAIQSCMHQHNGNSYDPTWRSWNETDSITRVNIGQLAIDGIDTVRGNVFHTTDTHGNPIIIGGRTKAALRETMGRLDELPTIRLRQTQTAVSPGLCPVTTFTDLPVDVSVHEQTIQFEPIVPEPPSEHGELESVTPEPTAEISAAAAVIMYVRSEDGRTTRVRPDEHEANTYQVYNVTITDKEGDSDPSWDDAEDANALGNTKSLLRSRDKDRTDLETHIMNGHIGFHPDCWACRVAKSSTRRLQKAIAYIETQPGHTWVLDYISLSCRSDEGSKYIAVFRCVATLWFLPLYVDLKSSFTASLKACVLKHRALPAFQYKDYQFMVNIITDFDGSWSSENVDFAAVIEELGITIQYSSPDRHVTKIKQENAVRVVEMAMKVIMITHGLPLSWWQKAADSAITVRNLWPTQRSIKSKAGDGASPLELITCGRTGRSEVHRFIHHHVPCGAVAWVSNPKIGGSNLPEMIRQRPCIAISMIGDLPVWLNMNTGKRIRSKDYVIINTGIGISGWTYFNVPHPAASPLSLPRASDNAHHNTEIVQLEGIGASGPLPHASHTTTVLPIGDSPTPSIIIVDSELHVVVSGSDGLMTRTGKRIAIIDGADGGAPATAPMTSSTVIPSTITAERRAAISADPDTLIGLDVYRRFTSYDGDTDIVTWVGVAHGIISSRSTDPDGHNKWTFLYDDGHREEVTDTDVAEFAIDYVDGQTIDDPFEGDLSRDGDDNDATITEGNADAGKFIETFDNEQFKGMCSRIHIDAAEHRLYYDWLRETHNIGHSHKRCDDSTAAQTGFYFVNPFGKAKKARFKAGLKFPLPTTEQWCNIRLRHQQSSASGNGDVITASIIRQEYQHAVDVAQVSLDQQRDADDKQPITAVRICLHLLQHTIGDDVQLAHFLNQERSQPADTDTDRAQDILRSLHSRA